MKQELSKIGQRTERYRIRREWTQARLAREAGLSKRTIERLEAGQSIQLISFLKAMQALGLLEGVLAAVPKDTPSPMDELARTRGAKPRLRASTQRLKEREKKEIWKWGDQS